MLNHDMFLPCMVAVSCLSSFVSERLLPGLIVLHLVDFLAFTDLFDTPVNVVLTFQRLRDGLFRD